MGLVGLKWAVWTPLACGPHTSQPHGRVEIIGLGCVVHMAKAIFLGFVGHTGVWAYMGLIVGFGPIFTI